MAYGQNFEALLWHAIQVRMPFSIERSSQVYEGGALKPPYNKKDKPFDLSFLLEQSLCIF